MRIENFAIIIGAMKAGTSSLYNHLATHPEIARCHPKEPNFFGSAKWEKGRGWYEAQWKDYDPARHAWVLEASTQYTKRPMHQHAAARIGGFEARFKFLYIVRDPVDRIESHLAHNIAKGRTTLESYPRMMDRAVAVSRYAFQLDRFREAVGGGEVLVLDFDELKADPNRLLRRCTDFLDIDGGFAFKARPPSNTRRAKNGSETFRLAPEERRALRHRLRDDMRRFGERYGFDTARWDCPPTGSRAKAPRAAVPSDGPSRDPAAPAPNKAAPRPDSEYWDRRQRMMYYQYVLAVAGPLARDARSLIDVGSWNTSIAEELDWIPDRVALDLRQPYSSKAVRGVKADFLQFEPERRFDFALCLQVLEHIPDAARFARKLQEVADRVLVSVPYEWPKGTCRYHCQDPVDERKLADWFGREPDYRIVVEEPLQNGRTNRRLIAYFHDPREKFDLKEYRRGSGAGARD
jgi:Sulfotransferase family